ncbi:PKD domain-containing protein [Cellulomonas soli]
MRNYLVVAALVLPTVTYAAGDPVGVGQGDLDVFTNAADNAVDVAAQIGRNLELAAGAAGAGGSVEPDPWDYARIASCGVDTWPYPTGFDPRGACTQIPIECADGAVPDAPLFRRLFASETDLWHRIGDWTCPEVNIPAFTAHDLRVLPIAAGTAGINPNAGPLLVNATNVIYTDAGQQQFTTDLLGYTFEVVVTPTTYTWDFGDGTNPLVTTDPGEAFHPGDGDRLEKYLTHVYTQPGTGQITLTTTWSGRYRIPDLTDWQDVLGTATTTTTSRPLTIEERRSHLVGSTCDDEPDAPGCG